MIFSSKKHKLGDKVCIYDPKQCIYYLAQEDIAVVLVRLSATRFL